MLPPPPSTTAIAAAIAVAASVISSAAAISWLLYVSAIVADLHHRHHFHLIVLFVHLRICVAHAPTKPPKNKEYTEDTIRWEHFAMIFCKFVYLCVS